MCGKLGAYTDVVVLPLNGRCRTIDRCIHHIVAALNAGGVETVMCCCGHGDRDGSIVLADGRELVVRKHVPQVSDPEENGRRVGEAG
jgi:hypothetical protein